MPSLSDQAELRALVDALCEETITVAQVQRLEQLLLADAEAEAFYIQYLSLHADLSRCFAGLPRDIAQSLRSHLGPKLAVPTPPTANRSHWRFRPWLGGTLALAAGLLLAVMVWPRPAERLPAPETASEPTDETVAVLLQAPGAQWQSPDHAPRVGAPLLPGWLRLKTGVAQIEFYNGAMVILQGPADFRLISRTEAYCARGKLRAVVPPQARGFTIGSPKLDLVDRGTEFGLQVTPGRRTEVHVFEGKVELYDPGANRDLAPHQDLTTGQSIRLEDPGRTHSIRLNPAAFLTAQQLADRVSSVAQRRHQEWLAAGTALRRDPSLLVYYPFQDTPTATSRTLADRGTQAPHDGVIVGCSWVVGRWPGKQALEFKRVGDRVRLHVPGEFDALTLVVWVRVDALANRYSSLLMTDGWQGGHPHWHLREDGKLSLGVQGVPPAPAALYFTSAVFTAEQLGQWSQLAIVYDRPGRRVSHYVDGQLVRNTAFRLDTPLSIGDAELGNWNIAAYADKWPIRNLNGCMDEFLMFSRALTDEEIERLYEDGRPAL